MNQNIFKNVKQSSFIPPPPPKINNRFNIPPKINYLEPSPLVRESAKNKLDYVDIMLYIAYGFISMFVLGMIMFGVSYFQLKSLEKNNKDNKDNIAKWNKIYVISLILIFIPLLILLFMICSKSPLSCIGLGMIR
jgi:Na+/H+ antiporter NhaC